MFSLLRGIMNKVHASDAEAAGILRHESEGAVLCGRK
jgi:hypothetical protein